VAGLCEAETKFHHRSVWRSSTMRVLLIEDHLPLANSVIQLLEAQGWQVDFAAEGKLGLRLALTEPFDVVILDLALRCAAKECCVLLLCSARSRCFRFENAGLLR
jgi:PleD family two-component response regulator